MVVRDHIILMIGGSTKLPSPEKIADVLMFDITEENGVIRKMENGMHEASAKYDCEVVDMENQGHGVLCLVILKAYGYPQFLNLDDPNEEWPKWRLLSYENMEYNRYSNLMTFKRKGEIFSRIFVFQYKKIGNPMKLFKWNGFRWEFVSAMDPLPFFYTPAKSGANYIPWTLIESQCNHLIY